MSKIIDINKEYFGKDRSKNYLRDDFTEVFCTALFSVV